VQYKNRCTDGSQHLQYVSGQTLDYMPPSKRIDYSFNRLRNFSKHQWLDTKRLQDNKPEKLHEEEQSGRTY